MAFVAPVYVPYEVKPLQPLIPLTGSPTLSLASPSPFLPPLLPYRPSASVKIWTCSMETAKCCSKTSGAHWPSMVMGVTPPVLLLVIQSLAISSIIASAN